MLLSLSFYETSLRGLTLKPLMNTSLSFQIYKSGIKVCSFAFHLRMLISVQLISLADPKWTQSVRNETVLFVSTSYQGLSSQTDIGITVNSCKCLFFFSIFKNKTRCQNHLCPTESPCGADSFSCNILKTSVSRGHACRYLSACEWDHMKRTFPLCCFVLMQ